MIKYVTSLLFITTTLAQFENVPENENIILLVGPDKYYASSLNEFVYFLPLSSTNKQQSHPCSIIKLPKFIAGIIWPPVPPQRIK